MQRALMCAVVVLAPAWASAQALPQPPEQPFDLSAALRSGPPMTADRAARIAVRSAPSIERARALERMAEAAVSRSRALMLPRLELSARYAHVDGFPNGQIGTMPDPAALAASRMLAEQVTDPAARALFLNTIDQQAAVPTVTFVIPRDQMALTARLTWPASDLFLALWPALEAAEAGVRAREYQSAAVEAQIARSARETYYQLARARGALAVAEQAQRQAEAQRARVDASVRAGFLTQADRLAADARVTAAEQSASIAAAGVEVADAALRSLLAHDEGPIYGIVEPVLGGDELGEPEPLRAATRRALARRPELDAMRETLASQRAAARASDASAYPHLAFFAGGDLAIPNRYVVPPNTDPEPSWEVGATLSWAPNDALITAHRGEELAAQYAAMQAELEQLERAVVLEVRQAHAELRAARRTLVSARAALASAEAAYQSRDAQLRAGETTSADLASAQNDLDRARLGVLDAAVQLRTSRARLAYATGR